MVLPYTDFSIVALGVFAVFYGLDWIATVPPTVKGAPANADKAPTLASAP